MIRELYNGYSEEKIEKILKDPFFDETIAATISLADSYMITEPGRIKYSSLHLFVLTGDRSNYEREYGQYYKRLDVLFCAYMLTKDEKYISPLVDVIWNICDLLTWSLPAHIKEDYSLSRLREFLDLVSCNNAARLAEIYAAIGDKFPELVTRQIGRAHV